MLNDKQCKCAICPEGKSRVRLTDSGGLYLEVAGAGSRRWFWKYYFDGKEKRLSLGSYPEVSLKDARAARDDARKQQQAGTDPVVERQIARLTESRNRDESFESTAREFHSVKKVGWSDHYAKRWLERLEKDIFPWLGRLPMPQITPPVLLQCLRRVEARGVRELQHSLLEACGQVLRYGVSLGRCDRNAAADLRGALRPVMTRHVSAILEPDQIADLMRAIEAYHGHPITRTALYLSALVFQRPGNMRQMEWSEVDLDAGLWTIPSSKMKRTRQQKMNGRPHLVPLAPQAVAALRDLHALTGHGNFVFPALTSSKRPMSENTVRLALRRLGFDNETMTPHGFRAMARTAMVERLDIAADVIEAQLAHGKSGPLGAAYDRAEFVAQRRRMMVAWADYLDELKVSDVRTPPIESLLAYRTAEVQGISLATGRRPPARDPGSLREH
ncbi:tyrosine-type recombinase/integrase [Sphaerotilus microaerophilus]|uniref:Integrase n=1 Tax=Sphaerotilus microaerophilus TaxID=2914710 RepID=A0ABM7YNP0_9BURK|nr:site-specific integrase [Sphaerotilus sp. FB-5]BDI06103.1 integrase [Sphaerotilus sp. FB-5]